MDSAHCTLSLQAFFLYREKFAVMAAIVIKRAAAAVHG
jgi:hypothetical protein